MTIALLLRLKAILVTYVFKTPTTIGKGKLPEDIRCLHGTDGSLEAANSRNLCPTKRNKEGNLWFFLTLRRLNLKSILKDFRLFHPIPSKTCSSHLPSPHTGRLRREARHSPARCVRASLPGVPAHNFLPFLLIFRDAPNFLPRRSCFLR